MGLKREVVVLAGNWVECQKFARSKGVMLRGPRFETEDTCYRLYVQESGAEGISADELITIGTWVKRFSPDFVRITRIMCEIFSRRQKPA